jgi:hypothetical protein
MSGTIKSRTTLYGPVGVLTSHLSRKTIRTLLSSSSGGAGAHHISTMSGGRMGVSLITVRQSNMHLIHSTMGRLRYVRLRFSMRIRIVIMEERAGLGRLGVWCMSSGLRIQVLLRRCRQRAR